ncbi:MAG: FeoA domain-containing protein [Lachnospiraceae bacterium]|nr:FeoA domain-containing protein [Lachnospiraceae bacterium]
MRLKDGKDGADYEVVTMTLPLDTERRLEVLGLTEGSHVLIMNNKKRGAIIVKIRGSRFALGQKIAENITVKEV